MPKTKVNLILSLREEDEGQFFWQLNEGNNTVQRFNELDALMDHARLRLAKPPSPPRELKNIYGEVIGYHVDGRDAYFRDGMETSEPTDNGDDIDKAMQRLGTLTMKTNDVLTVRAPTQENLPHLSFTIAPYRPDLEMRERLKGIGVSERGIRTVLKFSKLAAGESNYVGINDITTAEQRYPGVIAHLYAKNIITKGRGLAQGYHLRSEYKVPPYKIRRNRKGVKYQKD